MSKNRPTVLTPAQCEDIKRKSDAGVQTKRLADEYEVNINRIKQIILTGKDSGS